MDINVDKTGNSEALIKIKLKEDDYQPKVNQKIKEYSKKANIKGFRPGKVPPGLVKKMYGTSFLVEEVNQIVSTELNKVLRESDLQYLGEPLPNEDKMKDIQWESSSEFEFEYEIGYAEEFDLKVDKKTKVDYFKIKIDDKVIKETIENLQKQFGELTNPDTVGEGDTVFGQMTAKDTEIDQEVSIDLSEMEKAAAKKIVGKKVEEAIEIDAKKAFKDENYFKNVSKLSDDDIKAAKGKFNITIKGINHTDPAPVNQELFDKTFGKDAVKSEEEFKEKIKETISKNYSNEEENYFFYKLREKLVEKTDIKLPDTFLKKWLLKTNDNMTEDILEKEYEHYASELKWSLIRNKVSKDNDIKVENDEVMSEAKSMIIQQFGGAGVASQLGDQLDAIANNYLQGENGENYMKVYNQVQGNKVFHYLKEQVGAKEKEVSVEEFRKLS